MTLFASSALAQVEHNFIVGPNNTTCDSLKTEKVPDLIGLVRSTKFRIVEELKVSRYKVPRHVWFYSCDGNTGYLIVRETEASEVLFEGVGKEDWNTLLNSKDPITYYENLKAKYSQN